MGAKRDPLKAARLKEYIERSWLFRQKMALDHLRDIQTGGEAAATKWTDRSVMTAVNLKIAETVGAEIRARHTAETPRMFGMVLMQPRLDSAEAWEQMAASAQVPQLTAKEKANAIPGEVVQRGVGVEAIPGQLGGDVREEGTGGGSDGGEGGGGTGE